MTEEAKGKCAHQSDLEVNKCAKNINIYKGSWD